MAVTMQKALNENARYYLFGEAFDAGLAECGKLTAWSLQRYNDMFIKSENV